MKKFILLFLLILSLFGLSAGVYAGGGGSGPPGERPVFDRVPGLCYPIEHNPCESVSDCWEVDGFNVFCFNHDGDLIGDECVYYPEGCLPDAELCPPCVGFSVRYDLENDTCEYYNDDGGFFDVPQEDAAEDPMCEACPDCEAEMCPACAGYIVRYNVETENCEYSSGADFFDAPPREVEDHPSCEICLGGGFVPLCASCDGLAVRYNILSEQCEYFSGDGGLELEADPGTAIDHPLCEADGAGACHECEPRDDPAANLADCLAAARPGEMPYWMTDIRRCLIYPMAGKCVPSDCGEFEEATGADCAAGGGGCGAKRCQSCGDLWVINNGGNCEYYDVRGGGVMLFAVDEGISVEGLDDCRVAGDGGGAGGDGGGVAVPETHPLLVLALVLGILAILRKRKGSNIP